jgi:hypothetical protein
MRTPGGASSHCVAKAYLLDTFLLFIFVSKPGKKKDFTKGRCERFQSRSPPPLEMFFSFFSGSREIGWSAQCTFSSE